jgi:hypothetical protein
MTMTYGSISKKGVVVEAINMKINHSDTEGIL